MATKRNDGDEEKTEMELQTRRQRKNEKEKRWEEKKNIEWKKQVAHEGRRIRNSGWRRIEDVRIERERERERGSCQI